MEVIVAPAALVMAPPVSVISAVELPLTLLSTMRKVSSPAPPSTVAPSSPIAWMMASSPFPPLMMSLPAPPFSVSAPIAAVQRIVAAKTVEDVGTAKTRDRIGAGTAEDLIVARSRAALRITIRAIDVCSVGYDEVADHRGDRGCDLMGEAEIVGIVDTMRT